MLDHAYSTHLHKQSNMSLRRKGLGTTQHKQANDRCEVKNISHQQPNVNMHAAMPAHARKREASKQRKCTNIWVPNQPQHDQTQTMLAGRNKTNARAGISSARPVAGWSDDLRNALFPCLQLATNRTPPSQCPCNVGTEPHTGTH